MPQCDSVRRGFTRRRQGNGLNSASTLHSRGPRSHHYAAAAVRALLTLVLVCKGNLQTGLVVEEVAVTHLGEHQVLQSKQQSRRSRSLSAATVMGLDHRQLSLHSSCKTETVVTCGKEIETCFPYSPQGIWTRHAEPRNDEGFPLPSAQPAGWFPSTLTLGLCAQVCAEIAGCAAVAFVENLVLSDRNEHNCQLLVSVSDGGEAKSTACKKGHANYIYK
ncbi:unnamed protein product [Amoebophrya sp. A25]|nr:unnamed protein product [Amoebophrya sp. A25]|eukprot:GSA25T00005223001.1